VRGCIEDAGFITGSLDDAIAQLKLWQDELILEGLLQEGN